MQDGSAISERLAGLLRRELKLDDFVFTADTRAYEVPGWDSLRHVELLTAVEQEYDLRFRAAEVLRLKTVGDLQRLVDSKLHLQ